MQYRRVCIQRNGWAIVPGDTDAEALENTKNLTAGDFDWEPVNAELIEETANIIEVCGPNGEPV